MKRTLITIGTIIIVLTILIVLIVGLGTNKQSKDLDQVKTTFLINHKPDSVESVNVFYGEKTYYIIAYTSKATKYTCVVDNNEKIMTTVLTDDIKQIEEIKTKEHQLGYQDNKLIYEVKNQKKDGIIYSYYDALTGEFIKNIKLDK